MSVDMSTDICRPIVGRHIACVAGSLKLAKERRGSTTDCNAWLRSILEGYDKLKTYGFPIHGAICGYSRRIIWLELVRSNNNPKVTAMLYLDAVETLQSCPRVVRSDCGTENGVIAGMQCYFRADGIDEFAGEKSHQYGSSPSNQRIEGWWSFFRRNRSSWWIDFFKDMVQSGILELGNTFDMECLWFCFSKVLEKELENVKDHWNTHYIRKSRHDTVAGVPDILYFLPENSGLMDCMVPVPTEKL
ncbi:hypothetical protein AWC38_SpisGene20822 [Stylophora pistillata]|uniref:Integrase core domain-containing protein n=2 Tax=Stylophora pistillata TaxID=50429 RepID=A0A2B4RFD0_STYPI|nr:hypothetical protein AWC38_SpisGene20822 [Stylophora pistillata]